MRYNRSFLKCCDVRVMCTWVACLLMGSMGGLKAQMSEDWTDWQLPEVKPGAYHTEEITASYRAEGLSSLIGVVSPSDEGGAVGMTFFGLGVGVKIPVPELRSQFIPTLGVHLGMFDGSGNKRANSFPRDRIPSFGPFEGATNRIELSTEWRTFPLGHAKNEAYDWKKPWLGLGANVGYRPVTYNTYDPLHAGTFLKLGLGYVALFTEVGLLPLLSDSYNPADNDTFEPDIARNSRAIRYGFVVEF